MKQHKRTIREAESLFKRGLINYKELQDFYKEQRQLDKSPRNRKLMRENNLVVLFGQDYPKPDNNGFWELKSGENYPNGNKKIRIGDTVKLTDNSIASIKWIAYNPEIGGRVHYTVDWGASWEGRQPRDLKLVRRKGDDISVNFTKGKEKAGINTGRPRITPKRPRIS